MEPWVQHILDSDLGTKPLAGKFPNGIRFKTGKNEITSILSIKPVHFVDEDGLTKPIDNLIKDDGSGKLGNYSNNNFRILSTGEIHYKDSTFQYITKGYGYYTIATDTYLPALGFLSGSVNKDELIRTSGLTLHKIRLTERGVKEEIILDSKPKTMTGDLLVFETESTIKVFPDGKLASNYQVDTLIFNSGHAYDAVGNSIPLVTYIKGSLILSGIPISWLDKAVYPVSVDPTFEDQPDAAAGQDTYITLENPTTNYGTNTFLIMTRETSPADFRSGLVKFDFSSIPEGALVSSATFSLYMNSWGSYGGPFTCTVKRVRRAWLEAQATHNKWISGSNPWTTAGALNTTSDVDSSDIASMSVNNTVEFKDFDMTASLIEQMLTGGSWTNNGFKAYFFTSTGASESPAYRSSDHATGSTRPKISITYIVPAGAFFPGYMM